MSYQVGCTVISLVTLLKIAKAKVQIRIGRSDVLAEAIQMPFLVAGMQMLFRENVS